MTRSNIYYKGLKATSLAIAIASIYACDSGGDFESASTVSSQDPDPVVVDLPIAYIARPIPRDPDSDDENAVLADNVLDPSAFKLGARLIIKDRAAVSAAETVLTDAVFADPDAAPDAPAPLYDVKDLSVSADGMKLLFSMRAPELENVDEEDQPTWNIWEYDRETDTLRRIISSDLVAELGQDVDPAYLANGDIVFSSTRQPRSKAILLDENKPQFDPGTEDDRDEATFVLHRMHEDGTDIEQITFNESHDLAPTVLPNGDIAFMRWDNYVGGGHDRVSLYTAKNDGSGLSMLYGYHSQDTGTNDTAAVFIDPVMLPNNQLMVSLRQRVSLNQGGDFVAIDTESFVEINESIAGAGLEGPGQISLSNGVVYTDDSVSPQGYFSSAYPLFDGTDRFLVSWSACLVQGIALGIYVSTDGSLIDNLGRNVDRNGSVLADGEAPITPDASEINAYPCGTNIQNLQNIEAPEPRYGLWTYDPINQTQRPVVTPEEDMMYTEAVVLEAKTSPAFDDPTPPTDEQQALIDENVGVLHIRSVYDFHGLDNTSSGIEALADPLQFSPSQRPARFIRLLKAVSLPNEDVYDFDNSAFGRAGGQMKDILGYAPIEPDGSVKVKVPADVAFTFSILDAQGRRVPGYLGDRHTNWLTLRPGEVRECGGCHQPDDERVHSRIDAEEPSSWPGAAGGAPFPNTVLLDAFDTPHAPPENGETMAEYYGRVEGVPSPSVNIEYTDYWADESVAARTPSFDLSYADLPSTSAPVNAACQTTWTPLCRIVINYIDHVQPVFEVNRQIFNEFDPTLLVEDRTCTSCHSRTDAMGAAQIPAAQLELTAQQSDVQNDYITSYAELFFQDIPQVVIDGVLVDDMEQARDEDGNLLFQEDADGNLILDADGNPIPILVTVAARGAYLSPAGARNNATFFGLFASGGSHEDYLEPAELKLMAEWLDIGAQYYNNPFLAPEN